MVKENSIEIERERIIYEFRENKIDLKIKDPILEYECLNNSILVSIIANEIPINKDRMKLILMQNGIRTGDNDPVFALIDVNRRFLLRAKEEIRKNLEKKYLQKLAEKEESSKDNFIDKKKIAIFGICLMLGAGLLASKLAVFGALGGILFGVILTLLYAKIR
ncbi:MAG: hypothetical protein WAV85_19520 [Rhodoferax sp.]